MLYVAQIVKLSEANLIDGGGGMKIRFKSQIKVDTATFSSLIFSCKCLILCWEFSSGDSDRFLTDQNLCCAAVFLRLCMFCAYFVLRV